MSGEDKSVGVCGGGGGVEGWRGGGRIENARVPRPRWIGRLELAPELGGLERVLHCRKGRSRAAGARTLGGRRRRGGRERRGDEVADHRQPEQQRRFYDHRALRARREPRHAPMRRGRRRRVTTGHHGGRAVRGASAVLVDPYDVRRKALRVHPSHGQVRRHGRKPCHSDRERGELVVAVGGVQPATTVSW